jgi:hypothetical protein
VAEKSDGVRYQLVLGTYDNRGFAVMVNRRMQMYEVPIYANPDYFKGSVFDGELVIEKFGSSVTSVTSVTLSGNETDDNSNNNFYSDSHYSLKNKRPQDQNDKKNQISDFVSNRLSSPPQQERQIYLVFDVVCVKGESRKMSTLMTRYHEYSSIFDLENKDILQTDVSKWDEIAFDLAHSKEKIVCLGNRLALQFRPKPFVTLVNLGSLWRTMTNLAHKSDGLIIPRTTTGVGTGIDQSIFKWKQNHTVDLIVEGKYAKSQWNYQIFFQDNEKLVTNLERDFSICYKNGSERKFHIEIKLNPTLQSTSKYFGENHKTGFKLLGEFECEIDDEQPIIWCNLERWRKDKYTPNNYSVIQKILQNVHDNVTIKELLALTSKYIYNITDN